MEFYKNLYISESLEKKKDKIIRKLKAGKFQLNCYLIVLTENPQNHLEFFDSILLLQQNYRRDGLFVIGIADCYEGALELVQKITEETYEKRADADIRNFILNQQKSQGD